MFNSQEIGSNLVSLEMILKALLNELMKIWFHWLGLKTMKIPEFSLLIDSKFSSEVK